MNDTERLDFLDKHLCSVFPAILTTGIKVYMANLWKHKEIIHGEGNTLRIAIDNAIELWHNKS